MKHQPRRILWTLFDPWDGCVVMSADMAVVDRKDRTRICRMIQRAPKHFHSFGRPDGKPLGLRRLKTRTTLIY